MATCSMRCAFAAFFIAFLMSLLDFSSFGFFEPSA